jgi:hypothetical protein
MQDHPVDNWGSWSIYSILWLEWCYTITFKVAWVQNRPTLYQALYKSIRQKPDQGIVQCCTLYDHRLFHVNVTLKMLSIDSRWVMEHHSDLLTSSQRASMIMEGQDGTPLNHCHAWCSVHRKFAFASYPYYIGHRHILMTVYDCHGDPEPETSVRYMHEEDDLNRPAHPKIAM